MRIAREGWPFIVGAWALTIGAALLWWPLALLLGIVLVTVEWRHGSIVRTFLVTPRRQRVVLAKSTMGVLLGIAFAVVATLVVVAVAGVTVSVAGTPI